MKRIITYGIYAFVVLIIGGAVAFKVFQPVQVLPRMRLAPGFTFVDQEGQRITNEDMRGQFVLYTFTYTQCPEPCYNLDETMRQVQAGLEGVDLDGIPVSFVTISFDTVHDTPEVLNAYARAAGADYPRSRFVTADDADVLKYIIGGGFEVYYEQQEDGSYDFEPVFILVDGLGIIRGEYQYRTESPDAERIIRHFGVLAEEVRNSDGPSRLAYEAAHYFLCFSP